MSNQAKHEPALEEEASLEAMEDVAENEEEAGFAVLERLMQENEELKDRVLRTSADMENLRRRTAREIQEARVFAIGNFARDMLSVCDDLGRALEAVPSEGEASPGLASLRDGVALTERSMLSTLEKHGVKKLSPKGEKFDPNFHQAVFEIPTSDVAPGVVVEVMQSGYSIGERVLRPAMVGVSRAAPKPVTPEPGTEQPVMFGRQPNRDV